MTRITNSLTEVKAVLRGIIPIYDTIEPMNEIGMARTYQKDKIGVVNQDYKMILPAIFKNIVFCKNSIIIAENGEGRYQLFFPDGSKAMEAEFTDLTIAKICAIAF